MANEETLHEKNLDQAFSIKSEIDMLRLRMKLLSSEKISVITLAEDNTAKNFLAELLNIDVELLNNVVRQAVEVELSKRIEHNRDLLKRLGVKLEGEPEKPKPAKAKTKR